MKKHLLAAAAASLMALNPESSSSVYNDRGFMSV